MTPLKLLPDEALDSFISRNLVYSSRWASAAPHKKTSSNLNSRWGKKKIEKLAVKLGFERNFGYNFLIHYHTNYYRHAFVVPEFSGCYGVGRYGGGLIIDASATDSVKICPACALEDIHDRGFMYWRRSHQVFDINVCAVHNLRLIDACTGCSRKFELERHFFELPWTGCECGLSIFELSHQPNEDLAEQSLSKFMAGLYQYKFQLHFDEVIKLIKSRLCKLGLATSEELFDKCCSSMRRMHFNVFAWNLHEILRDRHCYAWGLPYVLAALFDDFSSFAEAVVKENVRRQNVCAEWHKESWLNATSPRSAPFHTSRPHRNVKTKDRYGTEETRTLFAIYGMPRINIRLN